MKKLEKYNEKRNFNITKEPLGVKEKKSKKLKFCVQHHLARKDHYDFRLEHKGVLVSFAIPKGPSYNPQDKRLAILVEDHPLSYRNFEGVIPKGEYGGGVVQLWDRGNYECLGNFDKDFKKGSLKIKLHGKRLKGEWALVRLPDNNWLLIKENDRYANLENISKFKTSIKSNLTVREIQKKYK